MYGEKMDPDIYTIELKGKELDGDFCDNDKESTEEIDRWDLPHMNIKTVKWSELDTKGKIQRVSITFILKPVLLIALLYLFVCSLDLLSSAFRLLGGRVAGEIFRQNDIFSNPIAGLMIGVLVTVLVQSSSTSTSIIVTMVGAKVLDVEFAIPMIFGANIGTTVTNTIVALSHAGNQNEFRRAFAGATVHDCFNWLCVIVLLPLHALTDFMTLMTAPMVAGFREGASSDVNFLKVITEPFTKLIVQIDSSVIEKVAQEVPGWQDLRILKTWCEYVEFDVPCPNATASPFTTTEPGISTTLVYQTTTQLICKDRNNTGRCRALFSQFDLSDAAAGSILLICSLIILCVCLISIVKLLHSLLKGQIAVLIRKTLNANFPGKLSWLTGYLAMLVGAGMTILVQSSSIFTAAMTPLVGIGLITVERMYPLTLGSNIGTTVTGMLASLTASGDDFANSMQVALCHLFFNIFGIILWYPIPILRRVPIRAAKFLGNTTADYRWFAIAYLILMYFLFPAAIFGLSVVSVWTVVAVVILIFIIAVFVILVNVLQSRAPQRLPKSMRTWEFLPKPLRSLEPYDRVFQSCGAGCSKLCKCCNKDQDIVSADGSDAGGSSRSLPTYDQVTKEIGHDNLALDMNENYHQASDYEQVSPTSKDQILSSVAL